MLDSAIFNCLASTALAARAGGVFATSFPLMGVWGKGDTCAGNGLVTDGTDVLAGATAHAGKNITAANSGIQLNTFFMAFRRPPFQKVPWCVEATTNTAMINSRAFMADDLSKITAQRMSIATLLTPKPVDAVAWYFALEHEARRSKLFLKQDAQGRAIAFAAVCQTGLDLFRPLVVLRGDDSAALRAILQEALQARRQYLFNALPSNKPDLEAVAELHGEALHAIYTLNSGDFKPVVNILVQTSKTPDGLLRAAIKTREGDNAAEAGTSWNSSRYAEMYVKVIEAARNRGLGKSVVSAVSAQVLQAGRTPLYIVDPTNTASIRLAERLGYRNTNSFEISGALTPRT